MITCVKWIKNFNDDQCFSIQQKIGIILNFKFD